MAETQNQIRPTKIVVGLKDGKKLILQMVGVTFGHTAPIESSRFVTETPGLPGITEVTEKLKKHPSFSSDLPIEFGKRWSQGDEEMKSDCPVPRTTEVQITYKLA